MIRLTYEEINKKINKTKATFYIEGLPEQDCVNSGEEVLYDYNITADPESIVLIKEYDNLEMTRDFQRRGLTLPALAVIFGYMFALFFIFIQMNDDLANTYVGTWLAFIAFLSIPAVCLYPWTRKKIFLYQVIGYKVEALCDVIDGKKFLIQYSSISGVAMLLNLVIAYFKDFQLTYSIIACIIMFILVLIYSILILTRVFYPGEGFLKFNKKAKDVTVIEDEKVEVTKTEKTKSANKLKYKVHRDKFLEEQKLKKQVEVVSEENTEFDSEVEEVVDIIQNNEENEVLNSEMETILDETVDVIEYNEESTEVINNDEESEETIEIVQDQEEDSISEEATEEVISTEDVQEETEVLNSEMETIIDETVDVIENNEESIVVINNDEESEETKVEETPDVIESQFDEVSNDETKEVK